MKSNVYVLFVFVVIAIGLGAWWQSQKAYNDLRIDDFTFGSSRTGLHSDNLSFARGEKLHLSYNVRGCTAQNGICVAATNVVVTGPSEIHFDVAGKGSMPFSFKKRSAITSVEMRTELILPDTAKDGMYQLTVNLHDNVAERDVEKKVDFSVSGSK